MLERKNRASKLDGYVIFSTLEPCAPGARTPPKLSCAERIVLAKIKEIWIGIEAPDPTVDREGIQYLQDHDMEIHMFDRDLQEQAQKKNRHFIAEAVQRAEEARENDAAIAPVSVTVGQRRQQSPPPPSLP